MKPYLVLLGIHKDCFHSWAWPGRVKHVNMGSHLLYTDNLARRVTALAARVAFGERLAFDTPNFR